MFSKSERRRREERLRQAVLQEFPAIPARCLEEIVARHWWQLGDNIPGAVAAHARHAHSAYEHDLAEMHSYLRRMAQAGEFNDIRDRITTEERLYDAIRRAGDRQAARILTHWRRQPEQQSA